MFFHLPSQAIPANFRRSQAGDKLIRQEMTKLFELEKITFAGKSLSSKEGLLRLQNVEPEDRPHWGVIVERAPAVISKLIQQRGRLDYGTRVHGLLRSCFRQLKQDPPVRITFTQLCTDIHFGSIPAVTAEKH